MPYWKLIESKRNEKKLTIKAVCLNVGITENTYHYTKSGKGDMNYVTFINICLAVGITELNLENNIDH